VRYLAGMRDTNRPSVFIDLTVEDVDVHPQALPGEQVLKVAEIHRKSFAIALAVLWLAVVSCIVLESYKAQGWMTGFAFNPRKVF
jgi:hypothetical protein